MTSFVRRDAPASFAPDVAAAIMSVRELCRKYRTSPATVRRWSREEGVELAVRPSAAGRWSTLPVGWLDLAPTMTTRQLMDHYSLSQTSVRWLAKRTGVAVRKAPRGRKKITLPTAPPIEHTTCAHAAHFLRRAFKQVHRCDIVMRESSNITWGDEHGLSNHGSGRYYVDSQGILANNDVVDLARRMGWECTQ